MMAHFGVLGLKDILTNETLLMDPPTTKEEGEGGTKDTGEGTNGSSSKIDPIKFGKSEK